MLTKEILDSHPLKTLKSEISKHIYKKIKGYSTMKRPELTDIMLNNKEKFGHLKAAEKKEKKAKAPKAKAPAKPKGTHKMPDGSEMTGKVHSKDSKPVKGKSKITIDLEKAKKSGVKLDLEKLKKAGVGIIEKKPKAPAKPKAKAKIEKLILGINLNKDKNLQPLKKEFIPDENSLTDMKKYKKILDEKNKNKKISKGEYQSTIIEVNKQINKLSKPKPKAKPKKAKAEKKDLGTYQLEEAPVKGSQIMFYKLPNGKITSARETAKEVWKKEGYSKVLLPKKKK